MAPHCLKSKANQKPVVMVPIILFTDDTSGNRSKQWNKFDYWAMRIAGLPIKVNSMLHRVHLLCCSNRCSAVDMSRPLVDDLLILENQGMFVFDGALQCEILLVAPLLCILADNPRHSEIMNHAGVTANKFCRICMVCNGYYL